MNALLLAASEGGHAATTIPLLSTIVVLPAVGALLVALALLLATIRGAAQSPAPRR